jgi:MoaA/NifB/PqqE/SkfB family radical SAM enzyme
MDMKVAQLQADITTYCNSHCGGCIRNIDGGETCVDLVHLPLNIFRKINFSDIEVVYFNGAYGDFTMHPDGIQFIDSIPEHVVIDISTNGGTRNKGWWQLLAKTLSKFTARVSFAIDGLSTNHLYRRGVDTEKVLDNAEAFIQAGGRARWKYIMFEHNKHEIETASQLARDIGFESFVMVESYNEEIYQKKYKNFSESVAKRIPLDESYNWRSRSLEYPEDYEDNHPCRWRNKRRAQLDAWGNIWQCCYMPSIATQKDTKMFEELSMLKLENNLHSDEYDNILQSSFFAELFDEPLEACKKCEEYDNEKVNFSIL